MNGLPRVRWHHRGRRYLFGWLASDNGTDATVIDLRGRIHQVPSGDTAA